MKSTEYKDKEDENLQGTKKTATALTVTIFKFNTFVTPPQPFKRRSTTTKPRLATYTVNGSLMGANLKQFIDTAKLSDIILHFNSDFAEDFISEIGKCFPQQVEKEQNNQEKDKTFESKYQIIDFSEYGVKILLRVSDHNINCNNITEDVEETYSLAFKDRKSSNSFKPNGLTVTEYVYFSENSNRYRYRRIAQNIMNFLETSVWDDNFVPSDKKTSRLSLSATSTPPTSNACASSPKRKCFCANSTETATPPTPNYSKASPNTASSTNSRQTR